MDIRRSLGTPALIIAALVALILAVAGCSSAESSRSGTNAGGDTAGTASTGAEDASYGSAQIFAAASIKTVGDELKAAFEQSHPGADLKYNFAGSSDLVRQIEQGAPADLFISANQRNMDKALAGQDFVGATPTVIATNRLVLALAKDNPGEIHALTDLPGKRVAVCAPEVPCGTIAHHVLTEHKIDIANISEESNVAEVSTKVSTGAVDAGFIYSTDARALAKQSVTALPIDGVSANEYPIALTTRGASNDTAVAFAEWLQGEQAQQILADHGFTPAAGSGSGAGAGSGSGSGAGGSSTAPSAQ